MLGFATIVQEINNVRRPHPGQCPRQPQRPRIFRVCENRVSTPNLFPNSEGQIEIEPYLKKVKLNKLRHINFYCR